MNLKPVKLVPVLVPICVVLIVCVARWGKLELFERPEWMTYDTRVRVASRLSSHTTATNLGVVYISDDSIKALQRGLLGGDYGLYWPRHVYGRVLRELSAQGARAVAFDVLLPDARADHSPVPVSPSRWPDLPGFLAQLHPAKKPQTYEDNGETFTVLESDEYFAWQLKRSGRALLATEQSVLPLSLFVTNALMLGDISANLDVDGVLRLASAFRMYTNWHFAFRQLEADPDYRVDLSRARIEPDKIVLTRNGMDDIPVLVDDENNFDLADFGGEKLPPGVPPKAKAFTVDRVWHMGIVLAAQQLKLDLANAQVDLPNGRIVLHGANGVERVLPVDANGYLLINWEMKPNDRRLTQDSLETLLSQDLKRSANPTEPHASRWRDKLVVIGSVASGNDLTDHGATPLEKDSFLISKHWNVANSVITGKFVKRTSLTTDLFLTVALCLLAAWLTWQLRTGPATVFVLLLMVAYVAVAFILYVQQRYWIPMVLPLAGVILTNLGLVTYRVVFEQRERRRVKSVFSKIVSPDVVNELLGAENLKLGGARRDVTVFFADVRGFTELTDQVQERVAEFVRARGLTGNDAETFYDESARETLETVNLYLACVADMVKQHNGTLDKYIGDCVMAFWGAPAANAQHALACVRAAIDAQRAIHSLNQKRVAENQQREQENRTRLSAGLPPRPPIATLTLGTGINTGSVTVGLMGSDAHILNYTVFGREVNLASRLETVSGRGRIVISEATCEHLQRDDPTLAAKCIPLEAVNVKGIRSAVKIYEVPWLLPGEASAATVVTAPAPVQS